MNKWGMKGIVLGLCLSMMVPMAVAMVPGMSVEDVYKRQPWRRSASR